MDTTPILTKTAKDGRPVEVYLDGPKVVVHVGGREFTTGTPRPATGGKTYKHLPKGDWIVIGANQIAVFSVEEGEVIVAALAAANPKPAPVAAPTVAPKIETLLETYRSSDRAWEAGDMAACFALKSAGF